MKFQFLRFGLYISIIISMRSFVCRIDFLTKLLHIHVCTCLQQQLSEDKECLKAASRLSEQLERKEEQIERLNEEGKPSPSVFTYL